MAAREKGFFELSYREQCYVTLRNIGCPEKIASAFLKPPKPVPAIRADECIEDYLQKNYPANYKRLLQRHKDAAARTHALNMAKRIGAQVARDIANDFR